MNTSNPNPNSSNPKDYSQYDSPTISRKGKAAKYRPVLTATQIEHILALAKSESPISQDSMSLISTLSPFQAKIQNAGIAAAYTVSNKPKANSLEALGGVSSTSSISSSSKEEYWEMCYLKLQSNPTTCSLEEIKAANEHKYLNELMTPEEIKKFERGDL